MAASRADRDVVGVLEARLDALERMVDQRFGMAQTLFDTQREAARLALDASAQAIEKAQIATERRFESVNEFRNSLADQQRLFVTRDTVDAFEQQSERDRSLLHDSVGELRIAVTKLPTRDLLDTMQVNLSKEIRDIRSELDRVRNGQGKIIGVAVGISAAITLVGGLVSTVLVLSHL